MNKLSETDGYNKKCRHCNELILIQFYDRHLSSRCPALFKNKCTILSPTTRTRTRQGGSHISCEECVETFETYQLKHLHITKKHSKEQSILEPIRQCKKCGIQFASYITHEYHIKYKLCLYKDDDQLLSHEVNEDREKFGYNCKTCQICFKSQYYLDFHESTFHESKHNERLTKNTPIIDIHPESGNENPNTSEVEIQHTDPLIADATQFKDAIFEPLENNSFYMGGINCVKFVKQHMGEQHDYDQNSIEKSMKTSIKKKHHQLLSKMRNAREQRANNEENDALGYDFEESEYFTEVLN